MGFEGGKREENYAYMVNKKLENGEWIDKMYVVHRMNSVIPASWFETNPVSIGNLREEHKCNLYFKFKWIWNMPQSMLYCMLNRFFLMARTPVCCVNIYYFHQRFQFVHHTLFISTKFVVFWVFEAAGSSSRNQPVLLVGMFSTKTHLFTRFCCQGSV